MHKTRRDSPEPGVRRPPAPSPTLGWWSRLLDGPHPWGSFDATVGQYGVRRYRLTIYPPGTTAADRRLARLWRGWPTTGAALGLLAVMLLGDAVPPLTVLGCVVAAYVGIGALLFMRAGPARVPVRFMSAVLMPHAADVVERRRHADWVTLVRLMTRAERMLRDGAISRVQHEAIWWETYRRLEATTYG